MTSPTIFTPTFVRVLPFAVFVGLTFFQDSFGEAGRYWIYLGKTVAAGIALMLVWRRIEEFELRFSLAAIAAGIGVFVLWVGLDGLYPSLGDLYARHLCPLLRKIGLVKSCAGSALAAPWNPAATYGSHSGLATFFIAVRLVGASLLVPIIEEVFWRSFVYRFVANLPLTRETLGKFVLSAFVITALLFGLEHREWLAGILCGCVYQGLVIWKKRLGDAIVAHGITNFLLGAWVVWKGAWNFW